MADESRMMNRNPQADPRAGAFREEASEVDSSMLVDMRRLNQPSEKPTSMIRLDGLDAEFARAMVDVSVPDDLVNRIQTAVREASVPTVQNVALPRGRRLWARMAIVAMLSAVVVSVGLARLGSRTSPLTEADLRSLADLDLNALPPAAQSLTKSLPAGWRVLRGLELGERLVYAKVGSQNVPLVPLSFRADRRSASVSGLLLALPEANWPTRVETTSFPAAEIHYASFGPWVVWREGTIVYVCLMRGDTRRSLENLQRVAATRRNVT